MMKRLLPFLLITCLVSSLSAQDRCMSEILTKRWLAAHGQDTDLGHAVTHAPRNSQRGGLLTIPVVVHVVWNTSAENVPDDVIHDIIDRMNEDYQGQNPDFNDVRATFAADRANAGIEFCLASLDPEGNATTGITRTQTSDTWFDPDNETNDMKSAPDGIASWDPLSYLNIWICDITSGAAGNLITVGYAYLPFGGMVGSDIDGLVLDYSYGTGPTSRTATHEVGHYLGLLHPWGDGDCANNDFLDDTPPTDEPTFSCSNTTLMQCPGSLTMYEDFMDYSDCSMMFTHDQADLMNGTLTGDRSGLLNSNGCSGGNPVEACIPTSLNGTSDGDYIDGVVLGTINNTGSGSTSGPTYVDYSSTYTTSLAPGGEYAVYVTSGEYESDNYAVWIDLDQDGAFADAEKLGEFTSTAAFQTWYITFDLPPTAPTGFTHMRVRGVYFDTDEPTPTSACYNYNYGETEDYGITIVEPVGPPPCLPTSVNGTNEGDYVDGVTLEEIDNTGSGTVGGPTYEDYTDQMATLTRGADHTLSVTSGDYDQDIVSAWIDYNDDGDFTADELVGETVTSATFETTDFPFTVPDNASLGTTRLRVRVVFPDVDAGEPEASDPCVNFSWGETEDYGILIQSSTGIAATATDGFTLRRNGDLLIASWNTTGMEQQLILLDAAGRILHVERPQGHTYTLATQGLSAGVYQVVVIVDGTRSTGRVFLDQLR